MKKVTKGMMALALGGMALFASQAMAGGAGGVPGSVDDPVVTKSYVDQQIQAAGGGGSSLTVVELNPGQTLYGFEGTEFIVRTGKVQAVAGNKGDGLTNLTAGVDLRGGAIAACARPPITMAFPTLWCAANTSCGKSLLTP
jgi:hypothetical protein